MNFELSLSPPRARRRAGRWSAFGAGAAVIGMAVPVIAPMLAGALPPQPPAAVGQGFHLNEGDLRFILKQIKIGEAHAAVNVSAAGETSANRSLTGTGPWQLSNPHLPFGIRTVDGSYNNIVAGRTTFGATGQPFPRLTTYTPRDGDVPWTVAPGVTLGGPRNDGSALGPADATSYSQKLAGNIVIDRDPRMISNLISDQTQTNPAAVAASAFVPRAADPSPTAWPCDALPDPGGLYDLTTCTPIGETLSIPNVTTDFGLSPPFNSLFTIFGQFFDHGVDLTEKGGGSVIIPLNADDPLIAGPDGIPGNADDPVVGDPDFVPLNARFMVLTRARNLPGLDGINGTADDIAEAVNGDTSWIDQSQTYSSIPSHQVFLRQYVASASGPIATGRLIEGTTGGMATWGDLKAQAATLLGIQLLDSDIGNIPMILTDPYGRFLRGPNGYPQIVARNGGGTIVYIEGNPAGGGVTADGVGYTAIRTHIAFLDDIAHHAAPGTFNHDNNPGTPEIPKTRETASGFANDNMPGTYNGLMLDAHFVAGDGRVNENIGLTAVHQVFHSEHNRLADEINNQVLNLIPAIDRADWQNTSTFWLAPGDPNYRASRPGIYEERLFQAARFATEMQYQHLVFEEFGRKVSPSIEPFLDTDPNINGAVVAEFAHAVYRFGHSMLTDSIPRVRADGTHYDVSLLDAFLNPPTYLNPDGVGANDVTPEQAAGEIIMGIADQEGQEIDEFVVETLRNNLLGLPLDLPTLNLARARDAGVPTLNALRAQIYSTTADASLQPYTSWADFGQNLKTPASLANFIAAYGTHATITAETTISGKRAAAQALVANNDPFLEEAAATSGVNIIDLWIGGLAEATNTAAGILGSTFNYVFEQQMLALQNGDRMYYLSRTAGMNMLSQLEGNSFAEIVQRNTTAVGLKGDPFSVADCEFNMTFILANISGTSIADDPETACDENIVLTFSGGFVRYRTTNAIDPPGINAQSTFVGTAGDDKMWGGRDTDTFWGGDGRDVIEGGDGADVFQPGNGGDVLTDSFGDDFIRAGDGDDAVDAGPGLDVVIGGNGKDFLNGGLNANTVMGGEDNDFVMAGTGDDAVEAGLGDDWIDGGLGNDVIAADSAAPLLDDIDCTYDESLPTARCVGGHDVIIGDVGEDEFLTEGGDDIIVSGPGIGLNDGLGGFDWLTLKGDTEVIPADMAISFASPAAILTDRFRMVEGLSGWDNADTLSGDSVNHLNQDRDRLRPAGYNALTTAGINRIAGLRSLLALHNRIGEDRTGATATTNDDCFTRAGTTLTLCGYVRGAQVTAAGAVPAVGNIIVGGGGGDLIRGRGGDDVIDGDLWLNVKLEVRTGGPAGTLVRTANTLAELTQFVMSDPSAPDHINPADIYIVRELLTGTGGTDVAAFNGAYADYDIWTDASGVIRVSHKRNIPVTGGDGTDTLSRIESVRFSDRTVAVTTLQNASLAPTSLAFGTQTVFTSADLPTTLTHTGGALPLLIRSATISGANAAEFSMTTTCGASLARLATCAYTVRFTPTVAGAKSATLAVETNAGRRVVALTGTGTGSNNPATGTPTISDITPTEGTVLTADTTSIGDLDGLGSFSYQWQANNIGGSSTVYSNVTGATASTFTPTQAEVNRRLRVVVSYVGGNTVPETLTSAPTTVVGNLLVGTAGVDAIVVSATNANGATVGEDQVSGGLSNDSIATGDGDDIASGDGGDDTLSTGNGNDLLWFNGASEGFDAVAGGGGTDTIQALANGTDIGLRSLATVEAITANGFTNVRIVGSAAANTLNLAALTLTGIAEIDGGLGADVITGSNLGADVILGGGGADTLHAGGGVHVDTLDGGADNDTMDSGPGNDFFRFASGFGSDTINGFDSIATGGQDLLDLRPLGITGATFAANVTIVVTNTGVPATSFTTVTILGGGTIRVNGIDGVGSRAITVADFILA